MANEYEKAFNEFNESFSEGLTVEAHSGIHGQPETVCYSAQEFFDADEDAANESWSNFLDSEGLEILVALDDALAGEDLTHILEEQCLLSFVNGQFSQFKSQFEELDDKDEFLDLIAGNRHEVKVLKYLVREAY